MTTTPQEVWLLVGEPVKSQKDTDRKFQETDRLLKQSKQETDRQIKELGKQIGGLGKKQAKIR